MLGVFFATISAACFGFQNASARRGALHGSAVQGLCTSMVAGCFLFLSTTLIFGEWGALSRMSLADMAFLSGAGFSHFVWGRYWNIRSLAAVGANIAGPVQQFQLLLSLTLAIIFLNESLTPLKILGILLIVAGPAYMLQSRSRENAKKKKAARNTAPVIEAKAVGAEVTTEAPAFKPRLAEGYICAILSGCGFGSSMVLAKLGLDSTHAPFAGGLVSYIFATIIVSFVLFVPGNWAEVRNMRGEARKWFTISGTAVSFSQMFRFLGLNFAPVTVVQPIQSTSLMFRMLFGYFINREHEAFDRYVIWGFIFSLSGTIALSVSDATLLQYMNVPDWLLELSKWKWPTR